MMCLEKSHHSKFQELGIPVLFDRAKYWQAVNPRENLVKPDLAFS